MNDITISLTNYNFIIPAGKNILVLSNYRTGSTALCNVLSKLTGYINYEEPFNPLRHSPGKQVAVLLKDFKKIIKLHPDHMPQKQYWHEVFENSFIIGLHRENFVHQLLSYIVAKKTNNWVQKTKKCDPVSLDWLTNENIITEAEWLADRCQQYKECRQLLDIELCYEQIIVDLGASVFCIHNKISDYNETVARIETLLKNKYNYNE